MLHLAFSSSSSLTPLPTADNVLQNALFIGVIMQMQSLYLITYEEFFPPSTSFEKINISEVKQCFLEDYKAFIIQTYVPDRLILVRKLKCVKVLPECNFDHEKCCIRNHF